MYRAKYTRSNFVFTHILALIKKKEYEDEEEEKEMKGSERHTKR